MKPSAYFINTGRGPTHNEADLIRALQEKKLAGAGLDVMEVEPTLPDNPLHQMDNVVLTPHLGGATYETLLQGAEMIAEEIVRFAAGEPLVNVVNREAVAA